MTESGIEDVPIGTKCATLHCGVIKQSKDHPGVLNTTGQWECRPVHLAPAARSRQGRDPNRDVGLCARSIWDPGALEKPV